MRGDFVQKEPELRRTNLTKVAPCYAEETFFSSEPFHRKGNLDANLAGSLARNLKSEKGRNSSLSSRSRDGAPSSGCLMGSTQFSRFDFSTVAPTLRVVAVASSRLSGLRNITGNVTLSSNFIRLGFLRVFAGRRGRIRRRFRVFRTPARMTFRSSDADYPTGHLGLEVEQYVLGRAETHSLIGWP